MTEEEYFRKTYPDSCYGNRPLSPYWDFFQDGVEFGERQSEKKIEGIENYFVESAGYGRDKIKNFMDIVNKALKQKGERIAELEQKLEQTEKDLADYQFNYPKIKELEKENERLKGDLELWESGGCRATNLFECGVVKELKEQIEKMKCCANCKSFKGYGETCEGWGEPVLDLNCDCTEWELRR